MKTTRTIVTALAATALLAAGSGLFACKKKEPEIIKIGVIGPFTGPLASGGEQYKRGIDLAYSTLPAEDKDRINLIFEDSEGDPKKAVSAVNKLIYAEEVSVIIGPLTSSEVLAVAPIAEEAETVLLTPTAPHKEITYAGDYIFRIYPSDEKRSFLLAEYVFGKFGVDNVGIIYKEDDFGTEVKGDFEKKLVALGLPANRIYSESFQPGATDFKTAISKIKNENPRAVLIVGHYKELGIIVKQSFELGFSPQFVTTADFENPEVLTIAGKAAEGVIYGSIAYDPDKDESTVRYFKENYQIMFNTDEEPGLVTALAYDALRVINSAVIRAGSNEPPKIKEALYRTKDFAGVTGDITFDENGDVKRTWDLKTVRDGKFIPLKDE